MIVRTDNFFISDNVYCVKKQKRNLNVKKQYYEKNIFCDYLKFIRFSNDYFRQINFGFEIQKKQIYGEQCIERDG